MTKADFLTFLTDQGAVLRDANGIQEVASFGDAAAEAAAIGNRPLIVPVTSFTRIRATGKDRAKFLHNFCTNNVTALAAGNSVEAFFTDVKARILAHGFVTAGDTQHTIEMIGGDETALFNHLDRYIISEDVTLESVSSATITIAILGADSPPLPDGTPTVSTTWNSTPVVFASISPENLPDTWNRLVADEYLPAGMEALHFLRICDQFPLVGIDVTSDHLAPEADRNSRAISYSKGCYLGQEPIARLDAMGHVNRALRTLRINAPAVEIANGTVSNDGKGELGQVTSVATTDDPASSVALGVLRVKEIDATTPLQVRTAADQVVQASLG